MQQKFLAGSDFGKTRPEVKYAGLSGYRGRIIKGTKLLTVQCGRCGMKQNKIKGFEDARTLIDIHIDMNMCDPWKDILLDKEILPCERDA